VLQPIESASPEQEAERFAQAALDALAAHIAILDETGTIVGVNAAWRRFAEANGLDDATFGIGTNYLEVCDRADSPEAAAVASGIRTVMAENESEFYLEYPCHGPRDNRWFGVRVTSFEWYGHRRYIVAHEDITERKRMEAELREKEKISLALEKEREMRQFKSRFLSIMSHELRTPLTSIRLSHDMLTQYAEQITDEEKQQYLKNIRLQVEYLGDLVRDVVTVSKGELQDLAFAPELTDLLTFCRGIAEEFQLAHHKTHRVTFSTKLMRVDAMIDKKLLRQALTNLLSNAIKYSPQGGEVLFALLHEGDDALICIVDEGIGIPQADLDKVFTPFQRGGNVDNLPGTGLGLAITKQAVELHGGAISVQSTVGKGTTFVIRLPIVYAVEDTADEDEWA
jgi:PAS domain S-box-containing protein